MPIAEKNSISSSSACSLATRPRRERIAETAADTRACDQATRRRPLAPCSEGLADAPPRCTPVAAAVEAPLPASTTCSLSPPRSPRLDDTDSVSTTSVRPPSPVEPAVRSRFTLPPFVEPGEPFDRGSDWLRHALRVVARRLPAGGPRVDQDPSLELGQMCCPLASGCRCKVISAGDSILSCAAGPLHQVGPAMFGRHGCRSSATGPRPDRGRAARRTDSAPTAASLHSTIRTQRCRQQ
jgi:hypothetical protein